MHATLAVSAAAYLFVIPLYEDLLCHFLAVYY